MDCFKAEMMEEKETIRDLYRRYWRCMIEKDADGLRELMADDYVLTHMTGVRRDRVRGRLHGRAGAADRHDQP